jgi:hypothetical protein
VAFERSTHAPNDFGWLEYFNARLSGWITQDETRVERGRVDKDVPTLNGPPLVSMTRQRKRRVIRSTSALDPRNRQAVGRKVSPCGIEVVAPVRVLFILEPRQSRPHHLSDVDETAGVDLGQCLKKDGR